MPNSGVLYAHPYVSALLAELFREITNRHMFTQQEPTWLSAGEISKLALARFFTR